jgi:hypothetical protein
MRLLRLKDKARDILNAAENRSRTWKRLLNASRNVGRLKSVGVVGEAQLCMLTNTVESG